MQDNQTRENDGGPNPAEPDSFEYPLRGGCEFLATGYHLISRERKVYEIFDRNLLTSNVSGIVKGRVLLALPFYCQVLRPDTINARAERNRLTTQSTNERQLLVDCL
ncbi:MAG: hypothetical protein A2521_07990 [Deltaproteobacteria bacterium RIFOXYD12_FULL_57_12]|nr:MAG: hypothetical protein A2521_07990 [Deltaproteobacteria bacterium RIFOXYD12_FULL_57_12]